jgi:AcrR family transcriptional regulator
MNDYSFIIDCGLLGVVGNMSPVAKKVVDKRTAIIDAAVGLFARKGFHATTVPEIAADAGVAVGSVYRYFDTKEALVNAAIVERKGAMLETMVAANAAGGDLEARFRRVWRSLIAFAIAHPDDFRFFEMHHHESYLDAASRAQGERLMEIGIAMFAEIARAYRVDTPAPAVLVSLVWGALVGLLKSADQGFVKLDPQLVDAAGLVLWRAVTGGSADRSNPSSPERRSPS